MEIRLHESLTDFRTAAKAIYRGDPILFTVELTILTRR
jgi:hypothetical protein